MSSDASQSILRLTLLASATAAFMVVWTGDSSRTVGMTLAERNRQIVPAHAIGKPGAPTQLARRTPELAKPAVIVTTHMSARRPETLSDLQSLAGGSYRLVFADGRVEWLTVIDRTGDAFTATSAVMATTMNGQPVHVIRVTDRPTSDSALR